MFKLVAIFLQSLGASSAPPPVAKGSIVSVVSQLATPPPPQLTLSNNNSAHVTTKPIVIAPTSSSSLLSSMFAAAAAAKATPERATKRPIRQSPVTIKPSNDDIPFVECTPAPIWKAPAISNVSFQFNVLLQYMYDNVAFKRINNF